MSLDILTYNIKGLPWCKDYIEDICVFISTVKPSILCLQEVFLERSREFYKMFLEAIGYEVVLPHDMDVTVLPSGLVTAFKRSEFTLLGKVFCPYLNTHNLEWLALKGFHVLKLQQKRNGRVFYLANTHTQSDTFVKLFFGKELDRMRTLQAQQIDRYFKSVKETVLIVGDLNCEKEPSDCLKFLHPEGVEGLKKRTFFSTGEDLDHVACLRDRPIPRADHVRVYSEPWSDHAAVRFLVTLPPL